MTAPNRCLDSTPLRDVGRHDPAADVRHARGHDRHQFRAGQLLQKWADGQRRFGLAHENAGRHVERFRAADAHQSRHHPGRALDDDLHDAKVIENGKERGHEDDRRQNGEREDESILAIRIGQRPKDEGGSIGGVMEQLIDRRARDRHRALAPVKFQHDQGEEQLQADAPCDNLPFDRLAVGGERPARGEDGKDS